MSGCFPCYFPTDSEQFFFFSKTSQDGWISSRPSTTIFIQFRYLYKCLPMLRMLKSNKKCNKNCNNETIWYVTDTKIALKLSTCVECSSHYKSKWTDCWWPMTGLRAPSKKHPLWTYLFVFSTPLIKHTSHSYPLPTPYSLIYTWDTTN